MMSHVMSHNAPATFWSGPKRSRRGQSYTTASCSSANYQLDCYPKHTRHPCIITTWLITLSLILESLVKFWNPPIKEMCLFNLVFSSSNKTLLYYSYLLRYCSNTLKCSKVLWLLVVLWLWKESERRLVLVAQRYGRVERSVFGW